jgi:hypothetical protein
MYTEADTGVYAMINRLIDQHHPELRNAGVTILCQMLDSKNGLKLHGYPCYATVKIVGDKDRAAGMQDARITLDAKEWFYLSDERKLAILDHELHHLVVDTEPCIINEEDPKRPGVFRDVAGRRAKEDDNGRPKLKMKLHDVQLGWFRAIAERHGEASIEAEQAATLCHADGQLLFPWFRPEVDLVEVNSVVAVSPAAKASLQQAKKKADKAKSKRKAPKPNPAGEKVVEELLSGSAGTEAVV